MQLNATGIDKDAPRRLGFFLKSRKMPEHSMALSVDLLHRRDELYQQSRSLAQRLWPMLEHCHDYSSFEVEQKLTANVLGIHRCAKKGGALHGGSKSVASTYTALSCLN